MHRIFSASALLLFSLLFLIPHSIAANYLIDGDVSDWGLITWGDLDNVTLSSESADKVTGDEQWGPGVGGQPYDVEVMMFDSNDSTGYLALITGFPIEGHKLGSNPYFFPGDVAIDVTDANSGDGFIYEFGIDLPVASGTADLVVVADLANVHYSGHFVADPWSIDAGSKVGDATFAYGDPGNDHYVYEFSFLLADLGIGYGDAVNFHWTMECGNNYLNLPARVNHTPEPATMLLLGVGLIGIAGTSRKAFKK